MEKTQYFFYAALITIGRAREMRNGPHPLSVHLGMAAANMSAIQKYASNFSHILSEEDAVEMVRGISMYQQHSYQPEAMATETIWSKNGVSIKLPLLKSPIKQVSKFPLLFVPSIINKANILDIAEERSMLRWFNEQGIATYLLDWGDFSNNYDKDITINNLVSDLLSAAICEVSKATNSQIDIMGYCMGGTLLLPAYMSAPEHIRRMILLAAPWDFKVKPYELARNVRIWSQQVLPVVKERGHLPSDWVQALFASIDPNGSAQKFIKFASMDQEGSEAKLFIAVEDWLNDGVDLPGNIASHCIQDWFIDNKLVMGDWLLENQKLTMEEIDAKILIMASNKDRLVPLQCAVNVEKKLKQASVDIIELDCGHVGLIVGRGAIKTVWQPIFNWLSS